ncbi:MAG: ABC transporter ATP-binding protein [Tissierellia bacterium]|nr:ABC transporter ATP-binding protein [Tissierellia bacterium]
MLEQIEFMKKSISDAMYYARHGEVKRDIGILVVFYLIISIINIFVSRLFSELLDGTVNGIGFNLIAGSLIAYGGARLLLIVNGYLTNILSMNMIKKLTFNFRQITVKSLLNADYQWLQSNRTGDLIGRLQESIGSLSTAVGEFIPDIIRRLIASGISIVVLIYLSLNMGLIFLVVVLFMLYFQMFGGFHSEKPLYEMNQKKGDRNALYYDLIANDKTVQVFKMDTYVDKWLNEKINIFIKAMTKAMMLLSLSFTPASMFNQLCVIVPALLGSKMVLGNSIDLQEYIMAMSLITIASKELNGLSNAYANIPNLLSNGKRIKEIWDAPKEQTGTIVEKKDEKTVVDIENCFFKYDGNDDYTIHGIDFKVKKGEKVALVGKSGCGKSTLLKLLSGIYPKYDGKFNLWGNDLNSYDKESLYRYMGFVPQESNLFKDTIYNNLVLDNNISDSELRDVLKSLRLESFLDKLDTDITEFGDNVSGGEKQRLSIARSILQKPDLLLLDEVTSALDVAVEKIVNEYLLSFEELTVVSIIHKLPLTENYDRIIVMDRGKIVEDGKYDDLIKSKGFFHELIMGGGQ